MPPTLLRGTFCIWGHWAPEQVTCQDPRLGSGGVGTESPFARSGARAAPPARAAGAGGTWWALGSIHSRSPSPWHDARHGVGSQSAFADVHTVSTHIPRPRPKAAFRDSSLGTPPSPSRKRSGGPVTDESQAVDHGPECARLPRPDCASHCPVSASWPVSKAPVATGREDSGWPFRRSGSSPRGGSCLVSCFPKRSEDVRPSCHCPHPPPPPGLGASPQGSVPGVRDRGGLH